MASRNWSPEETRLALFLLLYLDPSKLGGTRHRVDGTPVQHPAVIALAQGLGRTANAVVMKIMNLRYVLSGGSRGLPGGSKTDRETTARFEGRLDELVSGVAEVAGADTVARSIFTALGIELGVRVRDDAVSEGATERRVATLARIGQGLFRARVLANYDRRCSACGLRARDQRNDGVFLRAGHILPWRDAGASDRLDPANGLSLCAQHDRAFEHGLFTLDDDNRFVVSPLVRDHFAPEHMLETQLYELTGRSLLVGHHGDAPGARYLDHHRRRVFERFAG